MKREILFKAMRKDNGQWVEGDYFKTPLSDENSGLPSESGWFFLSGEQNHCIGQNGCAFVIDPETVCRFIGTTDKTGKKIFEGDYDQNYQVVAWCDRQMGWAIKTYDHPTGSFIHCNCLQCEGNFDIIEVDFKERVEIIGNIHEKKSPIK